MDRLLENYLGRRMGSREDVLRLCARSATTQSGLHREEDTTAGDGTPGGACEPIVRPAGGGGLTAWNGSTSLYINTANSRPHAGKYRNKFWREPRGELAGRILMT
eukprot:5757992-Prymnesium_polylepis.1